MSKFKTGDKVRIQQGTSFTSCHHDGEIATVTEEHGVIYPPLADRGPVYSVDIGGEGGVFEDELERVNTFPEEGVRYRHNYTGLVYYVEDGTVMVDSVEGADFPSAQDLERFRELESQYTAIPSPAVEEPKDLLAVERDLLNNAWASTTKHNGYHGREAQLHFHIDYKLGGEESVARAKELLAEFDTRSEMNQKMDTVREAGERRRQKLIAHTHKLEAVIRDRNAEIDFLREKLDTIEGAAIEASLGFVKPSQNN